MGKKKYVWGREREGLGRDRGELEKKEGSELRDMGDVGWYFFVMGVGWGKGGGEKEKGWVE